MLIKKIRCLLFFIFLGTSAMAQDTLTSTEVDQKTYQLYTEGKWSELISFGKMAINKGYNYFYLQMRIGIAYYEKKNYCLAKDHFIKALKYSSDDELALEYLYYCYVFVGRNEDARILAKTFNQALREKIGIKKQTELESIFFEGGTKIADSTSYTDIYKKTHSNYFNPAAYFQIGVSHYIKNRVSFLHAASYYNQENFVGTITQTQYYLKGNVAFKNNWSVSPAFHYVNINFKNQIPSMPAPPTYTTLPPPQQQTITTTQTVSITNYFIGSIAAQKIIKKFTLSLGTTFANMSTTNQIVHNGFISYAPFGNSRLVIGCTGYIHTVNTYSTVNEALAPFIFFQPITRLSIKATYFSNQQNNIIEDNGYFVNNSPDLTMTRLGLNVKLNITKHLDVYGVFQKEFKKEAQQQFNYQYAIFVGGIKINL